MKKNHLVFLATIAIVFSFSVGDVFAQVTPPTGASFVLLPPCGTKGYGLNALAYAVINIIQFILSVAGSLSLLLFIWGGVQWLTSGGSPDRVEAGKNTMRNVIFGLFIMFFAWIGVNYGVALILGRGDFSNVALFGTTPWHQYKDVCRP